MHLSAQAEERGIEAGEEWGAAETPLTFQRPVPRRLVHRASMAEVFVTGAVPTGEGRFLVGAQWPRDHALYHPDQHRLSDPLLFAETIRQALVYLAHRYYAVPLSYRFIGGDLDFDIARPELLRVGGAPVSVVLDAAGTWTRQHLSQRYDMRLDVVLTVDGERCGRGSLSVLAVDERRYGLLRRGRTSPVPPGAFGRADASRPAPGGIDPAVVGRLRTKDVVLEPGVGDGAWRMNFDLDHAILFDHPTDHLPLMALLEGFRQIGHLEMRGGTSSPDGCHHALLGASVECLSFGELDEATDLFVRERVRGPVPGSRRLVVEAVQAGRPIAGAVMTWGLTEGADTART